MKPIHIEFVKSHRWVGVWLVAAVVMSVATGAMYVWDRSTRRATDQLEGQSRRIEAMARSLRDSDSKTAASQATDPRLAQLRTIHQQLRLDWNPAFATIENIQEPGARLLNFTIDAPARTVRVEYEVESIAQATALTAAMNAGLDVSAWKLESVGARQQADRGGVRATWSASLDLLR